MALFDSIVNEVNRRFALGEKTPALLSALLAFITDEQRGGLNGFLASFDRVGLGNVAESWMSSGVNTPLSRQQLEDALGAENVGSIAKNAGISANEAAPALAVMIPSVVDRLTPDGFVPENAEMRSTVGGYVLGGSANTATAPAAVGATNEVVSINSTASNQDNAWLRAFLPLILVALLVGIAFYTCRPNQPTQFANVNASRAASASNGNKTADAKAPDTMTKPQDADHSNGSH